MTVLRPFLMLASVAFATGFAGYLAVAQVQSLNRPVTTWPAPITSSTATEAWVPGKHI